MEGGDEIQYLEVIESLGQSTTGTGDGDGSAHDFEGDSFGDGADLGVENGLHSAHT